jgi:hypothetical protein
MSKSIARLGLIFVAFFAVAVALTSLRYVAVPFGSWPGIDPGIRGVIERVPVQALIHMLIAPLALLAGPFQFFPGLRARHLQLHRITGRIYVVCCLLAGVAALLTAPHASGGPIAGLGFSLLAVSWVGVTAGAWYAAVQRKIDLHRLLMRFSYAMTFAAVTLRLQIPLGLALGYASYSEMSVWLAYTCWIPNVMAVGLYSMIAALRGPGSRSLHPGKPAVPRGTVSP